jgi:hypothetical protein
MVNSLVKKYNGVPAVDGVSFNVSRGEICNMTAGKDHRTYDLALAILNEEIEHESWFSEFLGEGPSGHFMRRGETSPFVSKFLK